MFYVRSPSYGSQEAIAGALALMWQVIPSVKEIYFKDLKQTLKKEQCDASINSFSSKGFIFFRNQKSKQLIAFILGIINRHLCILDDLFHGLFNVKRCNSDVTYRKFMFIL